MRNFTFNGKKIYLFMSGDAMCQLDDLKADWNDGHAEPVAYFSEILYDINAESVGILYEAAEIMSRAAKAARHYLYAEDVETVTAQELLTLCRPTELLTVREAVLGAISEGYKSEFPTDKDDGVDAYEAELQKKTEPAAAERSTYESPILRAFRLLTRSRYLNRTSSSTRRD